MTDLAAAHDAPRTTTVDADNPWPGLEAFREADAAFFFGRERARDELTRIIFQHRLAVLHGRSGLGKTSLLRAGVFPRLRDGGCLPVYVRLAYRSSDATSVEPDLRTQLKLAVERAAADAAVDAPELDPERTVWEWFSRRDAHFWNARSRRVRPVLVFDQFEEAFTHGHSSPVRSAETNGFLQEIVDLIRGSVPAEVAARLENNSAEALAFSTGRDACSVLFSLRQEFLSDLLRLKPQLPMLLDAHLELAGMTLADAERVVTGPGSHLVEQDVADRIVSFVASARRSAVDQTTDVATVDPAILSVFCRELNVTRQTRGLPRITSELVAGTQDAIIADFYNRSVADLAPDVRRFVEEELITESGYRDSVAYEEALRLPGVTSDGIDKLVDRRLVRVEGTGPRRRLELTHDVLLDPILESRNLRRLRERELQDREAAEQLRRIAQEAEEQKFRDRELTATRALLSKEVENKELARELAAQHERQAEAAERLLDISRRALHRQRLFLGALAVMVAVAFGLAILARRERMAAESQRQAAESNLAAAHLKQGIGLTITGHRDQGLAYIARAMEVDADNSSARSLAFDAMLHANWPLPQAVLPHGRPVLWAQFDPTGTEVVTVSEDNTARVWGAKDGQPIGGPLRHDGRVFLARFGRGGKTLLTVAEDGHARLWDVASGRELMRYDHPESVVRWAAITPVEDRVATGAADGSLRIWSSGGVTSVKAHTDELIAAQFDRTGFRLATASADRTAAVWDVRTGRQIARLKGHGDRVVTAQFSPNGQVIATGSRDGTARLWDACTGQSLFLPFRHSGAVVSAQFNPDGTRLATSSIDGTARLWDTGSGGAVGAAMQHDGPIVSAFFSNDGQRVVTASRDRTARLWATLDGSQVAEPMRQDAPLESAVFSPDGKQVVTTSDDGTARLWDVRPGAAVDATLRLRCSALPAQFAPDGRAVVVGCNTGAVMTWDGAAPTARTQFSDPLALGVSSVEVSADGTLVFVATTNGVTILKRPSGEVVARVPPKADQPGEPLAISSARFSPDGSAAGRMPSERRMILTTEGEIARSWDAADGREIAKVSHSARVLSAEFSRDATLFVTASADRTARVWQARTGAPVGGPLTHDGAVLAAQFDGSGTHVLTVAADGAARLWDLASGKTVAVMRHAQGIAAVSLSSDGRTALAIAAEGTAQLWDPNQGRLLGTLKDDAILDGQFSRDGRRIVTASNSGFRIWDAQTGEPQTQVLDADLGGAAARFAPDAERVVRTTADGTGTVRVWETPVASRDDAPTLAALVEAVVGYRVDRLGTLVPIENRVETLNQTRGDPLTRGGLADRVRAWVLGDREKRTVSPFTTLTVDQYIDQQVASHDEDARRDAQRLFPWDGRLKLRQ